MIERPGKIVAIGLNYMDHVRESKAEPPPRPLIFAKFPTSVIGPDEEIRIPRRLTERVDWEVELAAIIGERASRVSEADAERALLLWVNEPGNPTGSSGGAEHLRRVADWARAQGVIVASDDCYTEFSFDDAGAHAPPATVLSAGPDRALAVHSLSKRSNMAGLRAGFAAGDAELVGYLREVRKHAGLMTPGPVQAAVGDLNPLAVVMRGVEHRHGLRR